MPGQLADLIVLCDDYFPIPEEEIKHLESVLTMVGGRVVFGADEFGELGPPPLPVIPDWSSASSYGGYVPPGVAHSPARPQQCGHVYNPGAKAHRWVLGESGLWSLGCDCFAF